MSNFIKQGEGEVPVPVTKALEVPDPKKKADVAAEKPVTESVVKPIQSKSPVSLGDKNIIEMQKEIQKFSNIISKLDISGRKAFNNFMFQSFAAKSSIQGQELTTDPGKIEYSEKQPTAPWEQTNFIDNIKRIGNPKDKLHPEFKADGFWGQRTNNAVKEIYAFAKTLLDVSDRFNVKYKSGPNTFTKSDLDKMEENIKQFKDLNTRQEINRFSIKIKSQSAANLIPIIKKLSNFYISFTEQVLNDPSWKPYIEENKAMFVIKPYKDESSGKTSVFNEQEQYFINDPKNTISLGVKTPNGESKSLPIPINRFSNIMQLDQMMAEIGYDPANITNNMRKEILESFLNQIKSHSSEDKK